MAEKGILKKEEVAQELQEKLGVDREKAEQLANNVLLAVQKTVENKLLEAIAEMSEEDQQKAEKIFSDGSLEEQLAFYNKTLPGLSSMVIKIKDELLNELAEQIRTSTEERISRLDEAREKEIARRKKSKLFLQILLFFIALVIAIIMVYAKS